MHSLVRLQALRLQQAGREAAVAGAKSSRVPMGFSGKVGGPIGFSGKFGGPPFPSELQLLSFLIQKSRSVVGGSPSLKTSKYCSTGPLYRIQDTHDITRPPTFVLVD